MAVTRAPLFPKGLDYLITLLEKAEERVSGADRAYGLRSSSLSLCTFPPTLTLIRQASLRVTLLI